MRGGGKIEETGKRRENPTQRGGRVRGREVSRYKKITGRKRISMPRWETRNIALNKR